MLEAKPYLIVDRTWIDNVPPQDSPYWERVRARAKEIGTDGCTIVADIYLDSCLEHDVHWRTGLTIDGAPITAQQANRRFRKVIQSRSKAGRFSPVSWVRWAGVSISKYILRPVAKI